MSEASHVAKYVKRQSEQRAAREAMMSLTCFKAGCVPRCMGNVGRVSQA